MGAQRSNGSSRAQSVAIFVGLAVALYLSWLVISPFVAAISWAVVIAVLFFPVHARLERRIGSAAWSAALSTLLAIAVILTPLALAMTAAATELRDVSLRLPQTMDRWLDPLHPVTGPAIAWIEQFANLNHLRDPEWLKASFADWSGGSLGLVGGAMAMAVQAALIVVTMFFLFKDAPLVRTTLYDLVPVENRRLWALFARTRDVIIASVYGTVLVAIVQGTLGGLAFAVLGLPSPILWGVVMMLLALVPLLGPFVVWVPAACYLASSGDVGRAIALALWGTLVVGLADNLLRPMLVGNRTNMHGLVVFFGVLGGLKVFGLLGLIMGPVVFAIALSLIDALRAVGAPAEVGGRAA
jgi:predicted PurR-regulated permease PerM